MSGRTVVALAGFCAAILAAGPLGQAQTANVLQQQGTGSSASSGAAPGPLRSSVKAQNPATNPTTPARANEMRSSKYIQVPTGTILPLVLHNGISTRSAKPGDPVFLETLFPILVGPKIVIPAGSYVSGEVTESARAPRGHGRAQIRIKLDNLILPNGYEAQFDAVPKDAGTGGNETVAKEGTITGGSHKAADANTVAETTIAGAGIGGIAKRSGTGALVGGGIGAAAGIATILATRGPDAELPRGTTLDVELNRPLYLLAEKITFTSPGQASTLAGPPNRQPARTGIIPH